MAVSNADWTTSMREAPPRVSTGTLRSVSPSCSTTSHRKKGSPCQLPHPLMPTRARAARA
ncbi:MAG: hypothetical protein GY898_33770 [Proteobacteria bacterium]|nr:hypothetical protein [Pseudomonadota bacterium]